MKTAPATPPIHECSLEQFESIPGDELVRQAREALGLTATELADLLGVVPQTVWRWERDPAEYRLSARAIDGAARRVLFWMLRPGRPEDWPPPPWVDAPHFKRKAVSLKLTGDQGFSRAQIVQIAEALNDSTDEDAK